MHGPYMVTVMCQVLFQVFALTDYVGMSLKAVRIKTDILMPCFSSLRLAVPSVSLSSRCSTLLKSSIPKRTSLTAAPTMAPVARVE